MKNYKTVTVEEKQLVSITCDCCKKEYDDVMEIQEFLHYTNDAGYGSVMGDGNRLRLDLCQHCTQRLLGEFIQTEGNYIWEGPTHYYAHELPQETIEAIANSRMDPRHDHLNDLLDDAIAKHTSFKSDKPE